MKRKAIISLTSVLILSVVVILGCGENDVSVGNPSITTENMNHSIKSDNGDVLAIIYFDKPILSGESEVISKINEYFDTEYNNWLNDVPSYINFYNSNSMNLFLENVNSMRDSLGDDAIAKQPLQYTVDSETIF